MDNIGLVEYCKKQLGKPYWFGTIGNTATQALWDTKAKQYPKYYSTARLTKAKNRGDFGKLVHDCSGLIKAYIMGGKYIAKYDLSADAFYNSADRSGAISTIPEVVGLAVWRKGHIGVYIGNGKVIEAKGFDYGVVESDLAKRDFTHWLYIPFIEYKENVATIDEPVTTVPNESDEFYKVVKGDTLTAIAKRFNTTVAELQGLNKISNPNLITVGEMILLPKKAEAAPVAETPKAEAPQTFIGIVNTVKCPLNVRANAGMNFAVIKQLPKGSKVELFKEQSNGWYQLADKTGYVSSKYIVEA